MEISAKSTIQHKTGSLEEPHPPPELNQATPNAYQLIALRLCNKLTPTLMEAPPQKTFAGPTGITGWHNILNSP